MEIPQMLFLLVVEQLETWKQTAALKWDLCLFPVQAAEGQPGPASPSSTTRRSPGAWARGEGPGSRVGSGGQGHLGGEGGERKGHCLEKRPRVETLPNVHSSAAPPESYQPCDLDQVTAPSKPPNLHSSIC